MSDVDTAHEDPYIQSAEPKSGKPAASPALAWVIACIAILIAVTALAWRGSQGTSTGPETITVHGRILVPGYAFTVPCEQLGAPFGIGAGTPVVVSDASGKQLALGRLGSGIEFSRSDPRQGCTFEFNIPGVQAGVGPYSLQVNGGGKVPFAESEASDIEINAGK